MPTLLPSSEQPQIDTGRIHELADALLPVSNTIRPDSVLDNPYLNSCLAELDQILHELHPADIAAVLNRCRCSRAYWCGNWWNRRATAPFCLKYLMRFANL